MDSLNRRLKNTLTVGIAKKTLTTANAAKLPTRHANVGNRA